MGVADEVIGVEIRLGPDPHKNELFFTEAALLTFGGAVAVLPYLHQGAVRQLG